MSKFKIPASILYVVATILCVVGFSAKQKTTQKMVVSTHSIARPKDKIEFEFFEFKQRANPLIKLIFLNLFWLVISGKSKTTYWCFEEQEIKESKKDAKN